MRSIVTAVALLLVATLEARPADACSFAPHFVDEDSDHIVDVPVSGVLPLFVLDGDSDSSPLFVNVTDSTGAAIEGTVEQIETRVIWRAAADLVPGATYNVEVGSSDWLDMAPLTFAVESAPLDRTSSLTAGASELLERRVVDREVCCGGIENSCGGFENQTCYTKAYVYPTRLRAALTAPANLRRYYHYTVDAAGTTRAPIALNRAVETSDAIVDFDSDESTYCLTVTATSLLDGTSTSVDVCEDVGDRVAVERRDPDVPLDATCDSIDDEQDDPLDPGSDSGGCSIGGEHGAGSALALLLAAILLAGRRRR